MRMKSLLYPPVSLSSLCVDVVSKTQVLEMERLSSNAKKVVKLATVFVVHREKSPDNRRKIFFITALVQHSGEFLPF